jgi:methylated-DNA-[protein]-cysteine S-methyltransferase
MILYTANIDTPYGEMIVAVDGAGAVTRVIFPNEHARWIQEIVREHHTVTEDAARCADAVRQLHEYFAGERKTFDLPLNPIGTDFQRTVWAALQEIPYGETVSYKHVAERIGKPAAVRAVGRANGTNRIPIIIPCHRVIGTNKTLTGFGGGIALKERLLRLEGAKEVTGEGAVQLSLVD